MPQRAAPGPGVLRRRVTCSSRHARRGFLRLARFIIDTIEIPDANSSDETQCVSGCAGDPVDYPFATNDTGKYCVSSL